jgi:hypothetical protein
VNAESRQPAPRWDVDRFDDLQQRAWDLDALAAKQERVAREDDRPSNAPANRATARGLRDEAALLLANYWTGVRPPPASGDVAPRHFGGCAAPLD